MKGLICPWLLKCRARGVSCSVNITSRKKRGKMEQQTNRSWRVLSETAILGSKGGAPFGISAHQSTPPINLAWHQHPLLHQQHHLLHQQHYHHHYHQQQHHHYHQ
ncbi:unnamed protein product [Boreogadus saida]